MIEFDYSASMQCNCITFDDEDLPKLIKVFERALNTWSNPPAELIKVLEDMKDVK